MFRNYFNEHNVQVIPRYEITAADSLATTTGKFETPTAGKRKYKVDIMSRPSIPDNKKYWQVFEDDMQIKRFLELYGEFVNNRIDGEQAAFENLLDVDGNEEDIIETEKLKKLLRGERYIPIEE